MRVAFTPNDQLTIMGAVFNGDPAGTCESNDPQVCNEHGLNFRLSDPVLLMAEGSYRYSLGRLPGTVKLGGWHQEGDTPHLYDDSVIEDSSHGLYGIIDQMIYRLPGEGDAKGVTAFARVIGAPEDRSFVDMYWEAGLTFTGMIGSRPNDLIGIGFAHAGISDDASARQITDGERVILDHEALLEVSYMAQIAPGLTIQPDFQYIWSPGGRAADPNDPTATTAVRDAAVFGLRSTINY